MAFALACGCRSKSQQSVRAAMMGCEHAAGKQGWEKHFKDSRGMIKCDDDWPACSISGRRHFNHCDVEDGVKQKSERQAIKSQNNNILKHIISLSNSKFCTQN